MANAARHQRPYEFDQTVGQSLLQAQNHVVPVVNNILNMRVAQHNIGTNAWFDAILNGLRRYGYSELTEIIGTIENPKTPEFISRRSDRHYKAWLLQRAMLKKLEGHERRKAQNRLRKNGPSKHDKRLTKALDDLHQCPLRWTHWLTVIVPPSLTKEDALKALEQEGHKLERVIREKFPHARFIIFPEDDLVLVRNMCTSLFYDNRWRQDLPPNHVVFKNHFHCIVYTPGFDAEAVEQALKFTQTGRRSKVYGGKKQVLTKKLHRDPASDDGNPDVHGCAGYSKKRHFTTDVPSRALETAAEWFWLTAEIEKNPKLIRTGGFNKPIMDYCEDCETYHLLDTDCECSPLVRVDNTFYGDEHPKQPNVKNLEDEGLFLQEPISDSTVNHSSRIGPILNYLAVTLWDKFGNQKKPEKTEAFGACAKLVFSAWKFFFPSKGP